MCARQRTHLLLRRQKKVGQEKATPSLRPPSPEGRWGQPAMLGTGVGVDELAAFFELRSNSIDEPDDEACVSFGTHAHPSSCASRRSQKGWGAGSKTAAASQLRLISVRAARCRRNWRERSGEPSAAKDHAAERSNGSSGARSHPLLTVPRSAEAGVACVPKDTHASSSGSPQMSERSSKNEASCEAHPSFEHRRLPPRTKCEGDTGSGAAFSLVTFSWRPKRKLLRRRAHIPAPALRKGMQQPCAATHERLAPPRRPGACRATVRICAAPQSGCRRSPAPPPHPGKE
jgi:hypothetical protein